MFNTQFSGNTIPACLERSARAIIEARLANCTLSPQLAPQVMAYVQQYIPSTAASISSQAAQQGLTTIDPNYLNQMANTIVTQAISQFSGNMSQMQQQSPWGMQQPTMMQASAAMRQMQPSFGMQQPISSVPAAPATYSEVITPTVAPEPAPPPKIPDPQPAPEPKIKTTPVSISLIPPTGLNSVTINETACFGQWRLGEDCLDLGAITLLQPLYDDVSAIDAAQRILRVHGLDQNHLLNIQYQRVEVIDSVDRSSLIKAMTGLRRIYNDYSNDVDKLIETVCGHINKQMHDITLFLQRLLFTELDRAFVHSALMVSAPQGCKLDDVTDIQKLLQPKSGCFLHNAADDNPHNLVSRHDLLRAIIKRGVGRVLRMHICQPSRVSDAIRVIDAMDRSGLKSWTINPKRIEELFAHSGCADTRRKRFKELETEVDQLATVILFPRWIIHTTAADDSILECLNLTVVRKAKRPLKACVLDKSTVFKAVLSEIMASVFNTTRKSPDDTHGMAAEDTRSIAAPVYVNVDKYTTLVFYATYAVGGSVICATAESGQHVD